MTHAWKFGSLLVLVLVAASCASGPPLRTEATTSAIRAAGAVGAREVPRASLHLQLAYEELTGAQELAQQGKNEEAASLLQRAEADAELAILLSKEQSERSEAARAMERVRKLQADHR